MNELDYIAMMNTRGMNGLTADGDDYVAMGYIDRDINGHARDGVGKLQGKLPWHPSFSNESPYSTQETPAGKWELEGFDNHYKYTPSQYQIQKEYTKGLAGYLARNDPDATLGVPPPYSKSVYE